MASFFIDKGTILTIIIITLNAFLLAGSFAAGLPVNADSKNSNIFQFLPGGLQYINQIDSNHINNAQLTITNTSSANQSFITTAIDFAKAVVGFVTDIPTYVAIAIQIMVLILFGWIFFALQIGLPSVVIWAIAVPLTIWQIITVMYYILQGIGVFTGAGRGI